MSDRFVPPEHEWFTGTAVWVDGKRDHIFVELSTGDRVYCPVKTVVADHLCTLVGASVVLRMQFNNAEHPNAALYKALEVRIQVALTATREVGAITFWDKTKNFGTITRSCLCPVRAFLARNDPRAFEVGTIVDFQVAEGRTGGYVAIKIQAIQGESE